MANTGHARQTVRKSGDSATAAEDRRVRRTRAALRDAFLALVLEKGYEKTTIQDILDRADVGRSTFYVHYRDKEALLMALFDAMRDQLERELADIPASDPVDVTLPAALLYEHAYRNQRVYRALCRRQADAGTCAGDDSD
jgi:AcrR family transcriptional regulator